jgi:hypothetical protein
VEAARGAFDVHPAADTAKATEAAAAIAFARERMRINPWCGSRADQATALRPVNQATEKESSRRDDDNVGERPHMLVMPGGIRTITERIKV